MTRQAFAGTILLSKVTATAGSGARTSTRTSAGSSSVAGSRSSWEECSFSTHVERRAWWAYLIQTWPASGTSDDGAEHSCARRARPEDHAFSSRQPSTGFSLSMQTQRC